MWFLWDFGEIHMKRKSLIGLFLVFAFLCPIVGEGVLKNGRGGHDVIEPPAGTSFFPGDNQAGDHANENAINRNGGPDLPENNPHDGTPGYTPIWPD
jgi:hypothetical protein